MLIRKTVDLTGVVQGVGFRPTLFRLARERGLGGSVQNRRGSVRLILEGERSGVEGLMDALPGRLPPHARVDSITVVSEEGMGASAALEFRILASEDGVGHEVLIPADLAMCSACAAEVLDPLDRRYGYAFTTCTRCGPRYTVLKAMPYDRAQTTLSVFPLCDACRKEYDDPGDRRFHAESMACPVCGPRLALETTQGQPFSGDPLRGARVQLAEGRLVGVRGLGGFLVAADAFNGEALRRLRTRKHRPEKPLAVMVRDLEVARRYAMLSEAEAALMASPEGPIVIVDIRREVIEAGRLPVDLINPENHTLGMLLPTTPLHLLLFHPIGDDPVPAFDLLVMTSGNRGGEPICLSNAEARARLGGIADCLLVHDRDIQLRNDDSLCVVQAGGGGQVWRRARGYAPNPIRLGWTLDRCALAVGADMKNAVALAYEDRVVLSPHIGDLDTPEAIEGFEQVVTALPDFLKRRPEVVAVDAHPDMQSARMGRRVAAKMGVEVVAVQHHHAHAAACLAEHGLRAGMALVMDGTGWGPDGTIWGAEVLNVGPDGFRRLASFEPVPLPGGDAAVRCPARQLVGRWIAAGVAISDSWMEALGVTREEVSVWEQQCRQGLNAPLSHAAGRVFDSFSVVLGFAPAMITYEGQPAIRLEAAARQCHRTTVPEVPWVGREVDGEFRVDWSPAFRMLADRQVVELHPSAWAMAAHQAIARAALEMVAFAAAREGVSVVALSGGVFMNRILTGLLMSLLEDKGIKVLCHRQTPPGDGCIALGQAVIAASL
jgi:hydrogenase maturation protein HypF